MGKAVLITGSTGFLGRALAQKVGDQGARCLGVARNVAENEDCRAIDLSQNAGKLSDFLAARRPFLIFHLAGGSDSGDFFSANVKTTNGLFEAVARVPHYNPRIIIVGSAAEYGDLGSDPIQESARELPVSEYGVAKLAQTRIALIARRHGQRATVVRAFNVIGPGMSASLAPARFTQEAISAAAKGVGYLTTGDLTPVRDFLDLADVVQGLWAIALASREEPIVNLCSGIPLRMEQLLEAILQEVGVGLEVRVDPRLVRGPADIPVSVGDCSLLREITGLRLRFQLRESIARLVHWARSCSHRQ